VTSVTESRFHSQSPTAAPPPWPVEEQPACFVVTDSAGQKLAYVYFGDDHALTILLDL
jgi:hypothetical protein